MTIEKMIEAELEKLEGVEAEAAMWRDVANEYGAKSPPALGCLAALVKAAWGGCTIKIDTSDQGSSVVRIKPWSFEPWSFEPWSYTWHGHDLCHALLTSLTSLTSARRCQS